MSTFQKANSKLGVAGPWDLILWKTRLKWDFVCIRKGGSWARPAHGPGPRLSVCMAVVIPPRCKSKPQGLWV